MPGTMLGAVYTFSISAHSNLSGWLYHSHFIGGWPKSPFSFFCEIKDIFFIFTDNFIDLDILSISAISHYWLLVGRGPGAAKHLPVHETAPRQRIIWPECQ